MQVHRGQRAGIFRRFRGHGLPHAVHIGTIGDSKPLYSLGHGIVRIHVHLLCILHALAFIHVHGLAYILHQNPLIFSNFRWHAGHRVDIQRA